MDINALHDLYFSWLCKKVTEDEEHAANYSMVFHKLDHTPFTYCVPDDAHRYNDGLALRGLFAYENKMDEGIVYETLEPIPCSVFEMMVALNIRINNIMEDTHDEFAPYFWFWRMMTTLGLYQYNNNDYNDLNVENIIRMFLNRAYELTGVGSLFTNPKCIYDYDSLPIWNQAMAWLNQFI